MEISLGQNNKNRQYISWGISVGIHIILILIFLIIKYSVPSEPTHREDYLEIALGTDEEGWGDQVPEWSDAPAPIEQTQGTTSAFNEDHNIETSDKAPDQVKINSKPHPNKTANSQRNTNVASTPNRQPTNTNNNSDKVDNNTPAPNAHRGRTFTGTGPGGNSAQNNTGGTGRGNNPNGGQSSMGTPGGNPQGTDIVPRGRLDGRSIAQYPPPNAKYNEKGLVKIKVWVNRDGQVIKHSILSSPSPRLSEIASQKVKQTRFTSSKTAPEPQTGTIEFNFNVK